MRASSCLSDITAVLTLAASLISFCAIGGCVQEIDPDADPPRPRAELRVLERPDELTIGRVGFAVDAAPEDTDRNGFFDTWTITAYLFPRETGYPLAIFGEGDLRFTLRSDEGSTIARWDLSQEDLEDARLLQYIGETYRFDISLFDADVRPNAPDSGRAADRIGVNLGVLSMVYAPLGEEAEPIRADRALTVRVGPTGLQY